MKLPLKQYFPHVSNFAIGCMGFGGAWEASSYNTEDRRLMHNALDTCLDLGINFFDHADIYKQGRTESVFGEILKSSSIPREDLIIQSKCGIRLADEHSVGRYDFSKNWIVESVEASLSRLGTDYLDILLLHRPDPLMEIEQVAEAINTLLSAGKIHHLGVSNMHSYQVDFLQHQLNIPIVINQLEMSLANCEWVNEGLTAGMNEAGRFSPGIIEYSQLNNIQLQAWGCLAQGRFTRDLSSQTDCQIRARVFELASEYQVSPEAIVLAWLMRHPAAIQPVLGTTNPDRIKACVQAQTITLTREHWYELLTLVRGKPVP
ncbi:aldo/keto reductase [Parashewanella tropica]|uniref:aldo/keto reductase n=1 Tax=Parashewanella tropica TaxID=2547970 RepID=UPI00105A5F74|nr:aldo/keto reductase [Parashewanella tropica]